MSLRRALITLLVCLLASGLISAQPATPGGALQMSPELRRLLQAEMRELLAGTRNIAGSLPVANWEGITTSAAAMRDSYVLEKKLTGAQEAELAGLPEQFRLMDQAFHSRAEKLVAAAQARDAEAVSFQLSRLLDTCVSCHSLYATSQFPKFESRDVPAEHRHEP
jgi:cytochrome c556